MLLQHSEWVENQELGPFLPILSTQVWRRRREKEKGKKETEQGSSTYTLSLSRVVAEKRSIPAIGRKKGKKKKNTRGKKRHAAKKHQTSYHISCSVEKRGGKGRENGLKMTFWQTAEFAGEEMRERKREKKQQQIQFALGNISLAEKKISDYHLWWGMERSNNKKAVSERRNKIRGCHYYCCCFKREKNKHDHAYSNTCWTC